MLTNGLLQRFFSGETGIRTLGTRKSTPHFECGTFDHSAISPGYSGMSLPLRRERKSFPNKLLTYRQPALQQP